MADSKKDIKITAGLEVKGDSFDGIEASANAAQPPTRRRIDYRSIGGGGGMTPGNGVA